MVVVFIVFIVFIVLGVLYDSYVQPNTILSTLPSAGVGSLVSLMISGIDLSIIALVGLILLVGIVKKNAIMTIDLAIEAEPDEGLSPRDAFAEACLIRFRPILMATMAALLGALPLALRSSLGSELRNPLGVTIVGGLLVSRLLTIATTPVVYLALDRFTRRQVTHPPGAIAASPA